jgi:DNA topoisomerase-2
MEFYKVRLENYEKRKTHIITSLNDEMVFMNSKIKFIIGVVNEEIKVMNVKKSIIEQYLHTHEYMLSNNSYDYLIKMPLYNLTYEKKEELIKELESKIDMLDNITKTNPKTLWFNDIKEFEDAYNKTNKN